jgi:hypothetical protein
MVGSRLGRGGGGVLGKWRGEIVRGWVAFAVLPIGCALAMLAYYRNPMVGEKSDPVGCLVILAFTLACAWLGRPAAGAFLDRLAAPARRPLWASMGLGILATGVGLAIAWLVLDGFPNSGDESAYVLQAQTYARGRLWADLPAVSQAFEQSRFFNINGHWASQYAPGWALVLAPAAAAGIPLWIVGPIIGGLSLALFHLLALRTVPPRAAWLCTLAFAGSAYFMLNAASYFNHVLTAALGMAAILFAQTYLREGKARAAVFAGAMVGLIGITRTQDAAPFGLAIGASLLLTQGRRAGLFWLGLGGAPFLAALGAYNGLITGNPLLPPQNWRGDEPIGIGFAQPQAQAPGGLAVADASQIADRRTLWQKIDAAGFEPVHLTIQRLAWLWQWTSPVFLLSWPLAWFSLARRRALDAADWIVPLTGLMYLVYGGDGGNQYGPRYYFAAWPFALLTLAKVFARSEDRPPTPLRSWIAAGLAAGLVMQVAYFPARLVREHRVVVERQTMIRVVAAAGLHRAIVVVVHLTRGSRPLLAEDMNRNGLDVASRDVIYVVPAPGGFAALHAAYPGRSIHVFEDDKLHPEPGVTRN